MYTGLDTNPLPGIGNLIVPVAETHVLEVQRGYVTVTKFAVVLSPKALHEYIKFVAVTVSVWKICKFRYLPVQPTPPFAELAVPVSTFVTVMLLK